MSQKGRDQPPPAHRQQGSLACRLRLAPPLRDYNPGHSESRLNQDDNLPLATIGATIFRHCRPSKAVSFAAVFSVALTSRPLSGK